MEFEMWREKRFIWIWPSLSVCPWNGLLNFTVIKTVFLGKAIYLTIKRPHYLYMYFLFLLFPIFI